MAGWETVEYAGGAKRAMPVSATYRRNVELPVDAWDAKTRSLRGIEIPIEKAIADLKTAALGEMEAAKRWPGEVSLLHANRVTNLSKVIRLFQAQPAGTLVRFYKYAGKTRIKFNN